MKKAEETKMKIGNKNENRTRTSITLGVADCDWTKDGAVIVSDILRALINVSAIPGLTPSPEKKEVLTDDLCESCSE